MGRRGSEWVPPPPYFRPVGDGLCLFNCNIVKGECWGVCFRIHQTYKTTAYRCIVYYCCRGINVSRHHGSQIWRIQTLDHDTVVLRGWPIPNIVLFPVLKKTYKKCIIIYVLRVTLYKSCTTIENSKLCTQVVHYYLLFCSTSFDEIC